LINRLMKITEIINTLPLFLATVRAKTDGSVWTLKTAIHAEGVAQAKYLLTAIYGEDSVLSLTLNEGDVAKPLDSDQLRLKSMSDQTALVSQNEKRERARQKLAKAQKAVQQANIVKIS